MKNIIRPSVSVLVTCFCLFVTSSGAAKQSRVRLCTETEITMPTGDKSLEGLQWILSRSFSAMQWSFSVNRMPWQKCMQAVEEGRMDGIFAIIWTPERGKKFAFPIDAHTDSPSTFLWEARYHLFENPRYPFDEQNVKFGVGAPLGYVVYDVLKRQGWLSNIDYNLREGMLMVSYGRLDGFVSGEIVGKEMVLELALGESVVMQQEVFLASQVHVVFNRAFYQQHTNETDKLWQHMNRFRQALEIQPELLNESP